jgi:hypothetical protein
VPEFVVYERRHYGNRKQQGATVTVTRRGSLLLSEDAWTVIGRPEVLTFMVAKGGQGRLIGFLPCNPGDIGARTVASTRLVSAMGLLRHLGYDYSEARRFTLRVADGLPPYIDLDEAAPPVTSVHRTARGRGAEDDL